ncbi:growth arrest and DNA damage-inducible proteins-interacting protein 1 [Tachysurus fulvidraco]|uniref:growth arrest and DNA damage-inducible proteins-interacting protein 1 n=1 Tax=Tachysurus fulvidraco TaxID=1234273 RepID=UPI000F4E8D15|nr:growth arrest and DNA damage-inducible proteins-interacting protein 1 [Tachysurus fulvidraco]
MAASLLSRSGVALLGFSSVKSFIPVVSGSNVIQFIAGYNPRPLRLNLKEAYIPDRHSDKTPEWQKTDKYERKLFARYGFVSGVDPVKLWPTAAQLEELIQEEKQWQPQLEEMLKNIAARKKEQADKQLAREKLIAEKMAKMPKMIADWRKEKQEAKRKLKEDKAKKERLLAEARERFGYTLDPRSSKFQEMLAEIEKEEKKKRKLLKRQKREEDQGLTPSAPPAEAS